jgi:glycosyltransferase involved in cell wall biosynthesis
VRLLIFHGYLLDGTGSNVYNARLAAALTRLGHEVHLCCQDRRPETYPFVDASGDWDGGALELRELRNPVRCTVYRPPIGSLLPVYVADRYEGFEAKPFTACSDSEIENYVARNVEALREVAERVRPDMALANHLIMGPLVLARALRGLGVGYAVKVHGSALEYTVKVDPERFLDAAREGVASARTVLVGSGHTARSFWAALGADDDLIDRTRLGPPGVDIDSFRPRPPGAAAAGLRELTQRLAARPALAPAAGGDDAFARDDAAAGRALQRIDPERDRIVAYVGKLIVSKGVDLLLAAFPLVLQTIPEARLVVVGFGSFRDALQRLTVAFAAGDLEQVEAIGRSGRALEGGPQQPLSYLLAFLASLDGERRQRYLAAAAALGERVVFTGRLGHEELADLLPACEAQVVPSTFPEAFGMVAAEGAACGALPVSADHSGLAEVTTTLAAAVPAAAAPWLSFPLGPNAVQDLAQRLDSWLQAGQALRDTTRAALAETARRHYSWEGVARGVIDAARGELDGLLVPLQDHRGLG